MRAVTSAQTLAAVVALARLARGRARRPPLSPDAPAPPSISVVIPARDEASRIGPCLAGLAADHDVLEVLVVDDRSEDATAEVAREAGARVLPGRPLPGGWVGKPWALQQGLEGARGEVVVFLDADTRPRAGLARALAARLDDGADLVSAACRFVCDGPGERFLHPSMLVSIIYRYGPAGAGTPRPDRVLSNGQCVAARRGALLRAGGFEAARGFMTDDAALARALARRGWRVAFEDGHELIDVDMHDSLPEVWREWGRSIALADVTSRPWLAADVAVVVLAQALPVLRLAAGRTTPTDRVLLAARVALLHGVRGGYARRGLPFWLSPLADPAAALRLTLSALRPARTWRGRTYGPGGTAAR